MNGPYHLIPIALAVVLYYLLGDILVRAGAISRKSHYRFWNYLLLFIFLGCAVLGVLLTININYKLGWNFISTILVWHVLLGIAMSVVAFIHVLWHRGYFFQFLIAKGKDTNIVSVDYRRYAFLLGFLSVSLQVLLIRQFGKVFQGNELLLTWIIGIWMVLSGIGSLLGLKIKGNNNLKGVVHRLLWYMYLSAVLFCYFAGSIRHAFFPSGVLIPPWYVILMVALMMATVAIPSGLTFALLTLEKSREYKSIYAIESVGSFIGGVLLSLVITWVLNTYLAILFFGVILAILLAYPFTSWKSYVLPIAFVAAFTAAKIFKIDRIAEGALLPGQQVHEVSDSPYGSVTVTGTEGQINFYVDGTFLFGTDNPIYCEESVHYVMAQHPNPHKVLLVSGGYVGLLNELQKYDSVKIDYIEPNPHLLKICRRYIAPAGFSNIDIHKVDIRTYLRKCNNTYDITILTLPEPSSIYLNRYYSFEFYRLLTQCIGSHGVVGISLSPMGNYPSPNKLTAYSSVVNTIQRLFKNVTVVAGERDYLLASNAPLRVDIAQLLVERNIGNANVFVRPDFLNNEHFISRDAFIQSQIVRDERINTDSNPSSVLHSSLGYINMFSSRLPWIVLMALLILFLPFLFTKGGFRAMYMAGFAGSAAQTLILLTIQVVSGLLYGALGALVSLFMAGLAIGVVTHNRFNCITIHTVKFILPATFALMLIVWLLRLYLPVWLMVVMLALANLWAAFAVGFLYVEITGGGKHQLKPSKTYAADLLGSAAAIVLVTLFLIPLIGILYTIMVLMLSSTLFFIKTFKVTG